MSDNILPAMNSSIMDSPKNETDLIADFRKILSIFDRETQIYKAQINILKDAVNTLQVNEDELITNMRRELTELKATLGSIEQQSTPNISTHDIVSNTNNNTTVSMTDRQITDYLCQICLDAPRDCILEPCMHFCLCSGCVTRLPEAKCPICRRPIEFYQNVFIS